jgi:hypothetical protein
LTNHPGSTPFPRLQINLAVVRGHYADATRPHIPARARAAQFAAIRDIPPLIHEIERFWTLASEAQVRYANLRAAALATIAAHDAGDPDPFFYLRDELSAPGQRGSGPERRP